MIRVRFLGAEGRYQSIETQAVRIHKSLERWGGDRARSDLMLLPQDAFRRRGLLRRVSRGVMDSVVEDTDVLVVVKSSLFRGLLDAAPLLKQRCRERGVVLVSNPCDGPGADTGNTRDTFSEQIADYVLALSRLQQAAIAAKRSPEDVFFVGHASRLETTRFLEPREKVRKVVWENAIHHNPRYDPRKAGMPQEAYQELEEVLQGILSQHDASLVFIDAWRETQTYEEWERMMLDADIAVECKALGSQYVDYQAQKPAVKVLNYMSLGLPVICDPLPAYKDLGENGKELLFADTLREWRSQMKRLLEDRDLRVRVGEAARKAAEPFSIRNICKRYLDFFEQAVAARGAHPARSLQSDQE